MTKMTIFVFSLASLIGFFTPNTYADSTLSNELIYQCDLRIQSKENELTKSVRRIYLSSARFSKVELTSWNTTLDLQVWKEKDLKGYVNGQFMFHISGDYRFGTFESASANGTITCQNGIKKNSLLVKRGGFLFDQADNSDKLFDQIRNAQTAYLYCFLGEPQDMAQILRETLRGNVDVQVSKDQEEILLNQEERKCLESDSHYPADGGGCIKWSKPSVETYSIKTCNPTPEDPRI